MMKKKDMRNNQIYLPDYFTGRMAKSFDLEKDKDILLWDFSTDASETVKKQVEWILGHIVKSIKDREERRNQYLLPLKYLFQYTAKIFDILLMETSQVKEYSARLISKTGKLCGSPWKFVEFCRRELFLAEKEPAWYANVWYVDGLNINQERQARGSVIQRFSFLDMLFCKIERHFRSIQNIYFR